MINFVLQGYIISSSPLLLILPLDVQRVSGVENEKRFSSFGYKKKKEEKCLRCNVDEINKLLG